MSWIRSPLLHFSILGLLLFAAAQARERLADDGSSETLRVTLDLERIESLERNFVTQMGRRPGTEESRALVDAEIEEEILFQEALRRGLLERDGGVQTRMIQKMLFLEGEKEIGDADALLGRAMALELHRDDIVVRRILVQKMRLLGAVLADDEKPSPEDVAARYADTLEALREPDRISFGHVFLSADERGDATLDDARALRSRLVESGAGFAEGAAMAEPFPLGIRFEQRSERDLARTFGAQFGRKAFRAEIAEWSSPIESAYGQHLLWIDTRESGKTPPLAAVADRIRRTLERERQEAKLESLLIDLRARYEVVVPDGSKG